MIPYTAAPPSDLGTFISAGRENKLKRKEREKEKKYISPHGEDRSEIEVSSRPTSGIEAVASKPPLLSFGLDLAGRESHDLGHEGFEGDRQREPRELQLVGLAVQHCISAAGVKLYITAQTPQQAMEYGCYRITAECKRRDRLREITPVEYDTPAFQQHVIRVREDLRKSSGSWVLGRVHRRGKRDNWVGDFLVVARLVNETAQDVIIYNGLEEYYVNMDQPLTTGQVGRFRSSGHWGTLKLKPVPRSIHDLPTTLPKERA